MVILEINLYKSRKMPRNALIYENSSSIQNYFFLFPFDFVGPLAALLAGFLAEVAELLFSDICTLAHFRTGSS